MTIALDMARAAGIVMLVLIFMECGSGRSLPQDRPPVPSAPSDWGSPEDRIWISFQANVIHQQHPAFDAKFSGPESLEATREQATSRIGTLYTGFRLTRQLEILCNVEIAGGTALSGARGLGSLTNVDAPQGPGLAEGLYVARAMLHYTIPLGRETELVTRNPLSLASVLWTRRLEIRAGKMSPLDFFDLNSVGSDSHTQFTNVAVVNNGAYDYAADARGYTYGIVAEYYDKAWAARFGEMLMPAGSGGGGLDWNVPRARSENVEVEYHTSSLFNRPSVLRALSFLNRSRAATYRDAIGGYSSGIDAVPDTAAYGRPDTTKVGVGINAEHQLSAAWRAFWRLGWNDGASESTAIDRSAAFGADLAGNRWHRAEDKVGAALVVNQLSADHRRYLELGGRGAGLGDGELNYAAERMVETYYNAQLWGGLSVAFDYQFLTRPGYNRDRGPVSVVGFRVHVEGAVPIDRLFRGNQVRE